MYAYAPSHSCVPYHNRYWTTLEGRTSMSNNVYPLIYTLSYIPVMHLFTCLLPCKNRSWITREGHQWATQLLYRWTPPAYRQLIYTLSPSHSLIVLMSLSAVRHRHCLPTTKNSRSREHVLGGSLGGGECRVVWIWWIRPWGDCFSYRRDDPYHWGNQKCAGVLVDENDSIYQ